jgi:hypothetical protein
VRFANLPYTARVKSRIVRGACSVALTIAAAWALRGAPAAAAPSATPNPEIACRVNFGDACSEAMGRWLARVPSPAFGEHVDRSHVEDRIIDPAGTGMDVFLGATTVYGGTRFVYGTAGPPKGFAVYDPVHRIAYYDEGCCSWHDVVVASDVGPPPKKIATRSLTGLRTASGLRLGDSILAVERVYGSSRLRRVRGQPSRRTLSYVHSFRFGVNVCQDRMTFLFDRGRLAAMDFGKAC